MPSAITIENMYGNVYIENGELASYNITSSEGVGTGWYASSDPFVFSASTSATMGCDTGWYSQAPASVIERHKPKPIERFCEWCGALWIPATFREGCCQACGGPRTS
jgi:hypothetical protein